LLFVSPFYARLSLPHPLTRLLCPFALFLLPSFYRSPFCGLYFTLTIFSHSFEPSRPPVCVGCSSCVILYSPLRPLD
jgi:hypothetical protein